MASLGLLVILAATGVFTTAEHVYTATSLVPLQQYAPCRYAAHVSAGTPP